MKPFPLTQLKRGQRATIVEVTAPEEVSKLMEMGCLPGEELVLENVAPLGDPIAIQLSGHKISMRKTDAACFLVQLQESI